MNKITAQQKKIEQLLLDSSIPSSEIIEVALATLINDYDPIVQVDRSVPITHASYINRLKHPELKSTGPLVVDVRNLKAWDFDIRPSAIYRQIIAKKMPIEDCIEFADLEAIRKRGKVLFKRYFKKYDYLYGWRSLMVDDSGNLHVPRLHFYEGKLILDWDCIGIESSYQK